MAYNTLNLRNMNQTEILVHQTDEITEGNCILQYADMLLLLMGSFTTIIISVEANSISAVHIINIENIMIQTDWYRHYFAYTQLLQIYVQQMIVSRYQPIKI